VLLVASEKDKELAARLPAKILARGGQPATLDQAAERKRPYLDAGLRGLTFGNPSVSTPQLIAAAGEVEVLHG
jgi:hypothetical protein